MLPALIVAGALLLIAAWLRKAILDAGRRNADEQPLALLQNQVAAASQQSALSIEQIQQAMSTAITQLSGQVSKSLSDANKTLGERLDSTTRVVGDVKQQLGQLDASSRRILELGKDISSLQDILRPPKLRGGMGELLLGELLSQILPPHHYELQYSFKGGQKVDAILRLQAGLVPVDAKFPLENFRRIIATDDDNERRAARRTFARDVKKHVADIADKYIRMDEGTFDFALMYIPAENVYYEVIIKDADTDGDSPLLNYALKRRVIPVSPNSFYAYLQTILLGLKGMRVEERAREILDNISRIETEFHSFADAFRLVGQHLDNASKKYLEAEKRFTRVDSKMEQIGGLIQGEETEQPTTALPGKDEG